MKRFIVSMFLVVVASTMANAQILYRISGKNLEEPSYLFGTYHFASEKFVDEVDGLFEVFRSVDIICGETELEDVTSPEAAQELLKGLCLPEGVTYKDLLSEEDYNKLNRLLKSRMNVDLSNPYVANSVGRYVPELLSIMLQALEPVRIPGSKYIDLQKPIDAAFQRLAQEWKKELVWLEDMQYQLDILFGADLEAQAAELAWYLNNRQESIENAKKLVTAYLTQDIESINEAFDADINSGRYDKAWIKRLIDNRNKNWVKLMPDIMNEGSTLFVVGVGHLDYGKNSLIRLLRKKGYKVEAMTQAKPM